MPPPTVEPAEARSPDEQPRALGAGSSNHNASAAHDAELALLLIGSPAQVLARIVPGDPLGVRDAVADVLRTECVFLDADRVHLRALARIARAALRFASARRATPPRAQIDAWLRVEVLAAVGELLREAIERPRADPGSAFAQFARPLGLDPEALRRGCAAFNRLPKSDRAAFQALVVRGVGLEALAHETGESPHELGRRARRGLDAVLHANHPELPPLTRSPSTAAVFPTALTTPMPLAAPNASTPSDAPHPSPPNPPQKSERREKRR